RPAARGGEESITTDRLRRSCFWIFHIAALQSIRRWPKRSRRRHSDPASPLPRTPMLKKIRVDQVRLGMHLHALEGAWMDHPFWKTRFVIRDEEQLRKLQDSVVQEVWIDPEKGLDAAVTPPPPAGAPAIAPQAAPDAALAGGAPSPGPAE